MISKEKKQAIMAEYARTPGDTGSPEVQVPSFQKRASENGRSETWFTCIPEEERH